MPTTNPLYDLIAKLAPRIPAHFLYTRHDLISEVYLKAAKLSLTAAQVFEVKKLVVEASYSRYRPKYKSHSTATYTAEELEIYCRDRLVLPEALLAPSQPEATLWDYLREALSQENQ